MATIASCLGSANLRFQNSPTGLQVRAFSPFSSRRITGLRREHYGPRTECVQRASALICNAKLKDGIADFKPGSRVESDKLPSSVRKRAISAIDKFGGRVTIGDVASTAGLKLNEAEKALQAIAADSGGFLEVSDEGDVLYAFPKDYKAKLAAKSLKMKFEPLFDKSKAVAEYLIRVSFGTALLVSIIIVYTAIVAILSGRSDEDNRGNRQQSYGRPYYSGFNIYVSPYDLFWYWDPYYYRRQRRNKGDKMNFFESVFSFVFGDGDPNQGIEEERWKMIGEYITSKGGVVAAEELAPFLDVPPSNENKEDESYVLPVLLRFDGHPEVDDNGNILYRFPSLQRTASSWFGRKKEYVGTKWKSWVGEATKIFQEKSLNFSKVDGLEKNLVIALGGLNLVGVIFLGSMMKNVTLIRGGGFLSFVADIYPLLQIYAASFFAIPLWRWYFIKRKNAEIDVRNCARREKAMDLQSPDPSLRRKLLSARDMAQQTVIGPDRIIYSTDKDIDDQDYDAKKWERRFRELER
eukprot:TRINITY_DN2007_c0_g1_i1.p1 TRINITY_DN2007_c0_g1~~TRINITY_DN2007_c0_g1_i1.p1  ORF type:complete len:522 (-),score=95.22 TRINITY_DN2007_c0_g1_i1:346-1911(-)